MLSRRDWLVTAGVGVSTTLWGARRTELKIGAMDTVFRMPGNPEAVAMAKKFGLAGVQVTIPKSQDGRTLPMEDVGLQRAWNEASKQYAVPLNSTCLEMLHQDCLKDNSRAPEWVHKGISITKNLNATVLMLVFFGQCQVLKRTELDY